MNQKNSAGFRWVPEFKNMTKIWQVGVMAALLCASPVFAGTVFTDGRFTDWWINGYLSGPYGSLNGDMSSDTLVTQGNPGAAYRIILGAPNGAGSSQWGIALATAYSSSIVYNPPSWERSTRSTHRWILIAYYS